LQPEIAVVIIELSLQRNEVNIVVIEMMLGLPWLEGIPLLQRLLLLLIT